MVTIELELIGRDGCHLCEQAQAVVTAVCHGRSDVHVRERSIADEPELRERFHDEIPVVLINGVQHSYWRVDPERLRAALDRLSG